MSASASGPPRLVIVVAFESRRVGVHIEGIENREAAEKFANWVADDAALHELVLRTLDLAQPRAGDLEDTFGLVEALAAELGPRPADPDTYAALVPLGSLQSKTLRYVVDRLDREFQGRWFEWALAREWSLDPGFAHALHAVAAAEGFAEPGAANGCTEDAA